MNELPTYIHGLIAMILALSPLAVAAYYDLKQNREAKQKNR